MAVAITGAAGFLGKQVTRTLRDRGRAVVALDLKPGEALRKLAEGDSDLHIVEGDMTSFPQISNLITQHDVRAIIPLAYFDAPTENLIGAAKQRPYEAAIANEVGFDNVLEIGRQHDIETIVWPSSAVVLGTSAYYADLGIETVDEESPTTATSLYGACKLKNEYVARVYRDAYNMDIAGLRLPLVYGPDRPAGGQPFITDLFEVAAAGGDITISDSDTTWELLYVKDVGTLFADVLEADSYPDDVYNVGGYTITVRELVDLVRDAAHPDATISVEPGADEMLAAPLDNSRLHATVDFDPAWPPKRAVDDFLDELST